MGQCWSSVVEAGPTRTINGSVTRTCWGIIGADLVLGHQPVVWWAWHRSQHKALIRCRTNSGPLPTALAQR